MATASTRKSTSALKTRKSSRSNVKPLVVYTARSLDGTSFGLDTESQMRVRQTFPDVHVSTRHVYVAHDTREVVSESIHRFEKQVIELLTGLSVERLAEKFSVSFRDPWSEKEIVHLSVEAKVA